MSRNKAVGYHITMRLEEDWGVARTPEALRHVSCMMVRHGEKRGLLAHRVADTHLHVLLQCDRVKAGQFAHAIESALRQTLQLPVSFERARIRPLRSPRHLANALRYVLRQEEHHGTRFDPAHEGSSVQDLLGMRVLWRDGSTRRLTSLLPRLQRAEVLSWIDAEALDSVIPDTRLAPEAALAALGLSSFVGQSPPHVAARRLLVHNSPNISALATILPDCSPRALRYLRATPVKPVHAKAMAMQLRYRTLLSGQVFGGGLGDAAVDGVLVVDEGGHGLPVGRLQVAAMVVEAEDRHAAHEVVAVLEQRKKRGDGLRGGRFAKLDVAEGVGSSPAQDGEATG